MIFLALSTATTSSRAGNTTVDDRDATRSVTLFAAPFENLTGRDEYGPAAAGLGDLVGAVLGRQPRVRIVERQRIRLLTKEQALSLKGLTAQRYAVDAGRMFRADAVFVGRLSMEKEKFVIDVKILEIATSKVMAAAQRQCSADRFIDAATELAGLLVEQLAVPRGPATPERNATTPAASIDFMKGLAHYYAGNLDAAIMQFMRVIDLDPDYEEAIYLSGKAYYRQKQYAHAVIEWERYVAIWTNSARADEVRKALAEARGRQGDARVRLLDRTVAESPSRSGARTPTRIRTRTQSQTRTQTRTQTRPRPTRGSPAGAKRLQKAIGRAKTYKGIGKINKARGILRQAIAQDPNHPVADDARKLLSEWSE